MSDVRCWDSSFHSSACVAVWFTRAEMEDPAALIANLRSRHAEMEAQLLAYRESFLQHEAIGALVVTLDGPKK